MIKTLEKPRNPQAEIKDAFKPGVDNVLTPAAIEFLTALHRNFDARRKELLQARVRKQALWDQGKLPDFLPETNFIRSGTWQALPVPHVLQDRRVEITGPVDRKMIINALNSGANSFMADFEDSTSPTWENILEGHQNLMDAVRGTISYVTPKKVYALNEQVAVLMVRPRGWHLDEKHIVIDGQPMAASLVDFGLFVFHNGVFLAEQQRGPFFYLPKLESHHEARLWDDVFLFTENALNIKRGIIKATVLIETILAAFEMEEIIYELREHIAGLNAGRWDYIFSIIKKFKNNRAFITPDRANITMEVPFMKAYAELLVKTCHKRGIHAIGGMSAFIPSKDEAINKAAYEKVRADKQREARQGYDGTWVAHPGLVAVAKAEFDAVLNEAPHQKHVMRNDVQVNANSLLQVSSAGAEITEKGLRTNINVALLYLESWLRGTGAAALHNLMEDAATAEISRAQLWQWLNHERVVLADGRVFNLELYLKIQEEEMMLLLKEFLAENRDIQSLYLAEEILDKLVLSNGFEEFLTTLAYNKL
jgi:malate synthase